MNELLANAVKTTLALASDRGITEIEVAAQGSDGFSVGVRKGQPEVLSYEQKQNLSITVYDKGRLGHVSTTQCHPAALEKALAHALSIAKIAHPDPCHGLPDKAWISKAYPSLAIDFPSDLLPDDIIPKLIAAEKAALAYDKHICMTEEMNFSTSRRHDYYGNSFGFLGQYAQTHYSMSGVVLAQGKDGMERDFEYAVSSDVKDLPDFSEIAQKASQKALARLDPKSLATQSLPVIFLPEAATDIISALLSAIKGRAIYQKSSFLVDAIGEQLFPQWFALNEMPHLAKAQGSAPFDAEGLVTRPKKIIDGGILQTYLLNTYSARRLQMSSTANAGGVHNAVVKPSDTSLEALIKKMYRGLIVSEVFSDGANIITGDYSQGVAGFFVDKGEIQYPVAKITVAGTLRDMFKNIEAVGSDVDIRSHIRTPSILMGEMMVAGEG
jgi:PmbA protein